LSEILITEHERHSSFLAFGREALANGTRLLEINVPGVGFASGVLEREGEDGAALLDGVFAVGVRGGEGPRDLVEGGGGREGI
jgi:hypothetical protein